MRMRQGALWFALLASGCIDLSQLRAAPDDAFWAASDPNNIDIVARDVDLLPAVEADAAPPVDGGPVPIFFDDFETANATFQDRWNYPCTGNDFICGSATTARLDRVTAPV